MDTVIWFLLILSLLVFIIGLINPQWVVFRGEKSRGRTARIYGIFILLCIFIALVLISIKSHQFDNTQSSPAKIPSISPSSQPNDYTNLLELAAKKLRPGQIAFTVPQEMQVEKDELVKARISDDLQNDLKAGLSGNPQTAPIKVSDFMEANLTGQNFTIKPITKENQVLLKGQVTEWRWSVTPTDQGEQTLSLIVSARIKIPNQTEESIQLEVLDRSIKVAVNPNYWFSQNWQWIVENWSTIMAILTGSSVFILARWQWIKNLIQNQFNKKMP
ncbi:hypothetical protein [Calothrix sp. PCC 7507]|uniref:hypothetical protein n=1 Tax=Calothrix sp. PCC 7507 TaxID=99598 RepID=UPI00029ED02F|nr:hypothetical protein [Calothrix sp. PCC 7507]AFY36083.1 hypothetical protein Cal7507_5763 [Calothrix sp. PCC 7507]